MTGSGCAGVGEAVSLQKLPEAVKANAAIWVHLEVSIISGCAHFSNVLLPPAQCLSALAGLLHSMECHLIYNSSHCDTNCIPPHQPSFVYQSFLYDIHKPKYLLLQCDFRMCCSIAVFHI